MDDEDSIRQALDRAENAIGATVVEAIDWLQEQNSTDDIERRIAAGQVQDVVTEVDRAGEMIADKVNSFFDRALHDVAQSITDSIDTRFHADPQNPIAVQAMRDNRLRMVRELVEEQRAVVREVLIEGVQLAENPRQIAIAIRETIGLTRYQLQQVENYRLHLTRGSAGALDYQLRDRRFDPTVRRAVAGERPLSQAQIDRMVERYRERRIAFRAETIARTEALRSVHQGADEAYRQAIARGDLRADQLERTWHHFAAQKHPREFHASMNGDIVDWNSSFVSGLGNVIRFPGDPNAPADETINCHCGVSVRIKTSAARLAA